MSILDFTSPFSAKKAVFSLLLILFLTFPALGDVVYPDYTGQQVIDLTGQVSKGYQTNLERNMQQYDIEMRVLFIDGKEINLGIYAAKLFDRWEMPERSILVVIDPNTNKIGYGVGKEVRDMLKDREYIQVDDKKPPKEQQVDTETLIDYNNLTEAIIQKFTMEKVEVSSQQQKSNSGESGSSYKYLPPHVEDALGKSSEENDLTRRSVSLTSIIVGLILFLLIGAGVLVFRSYKEKKRLKELQTSYSIDGEVLYQELEDMYDKIVKNIERMNKFKGQTKEEITAHLEVLEKEPDKISVLMDKLNDTITDMNTENLDDIADIIEKSNDRIITLTKLHKESIAYRKDFKSITDKSAMTMSDVRVNLGNCRNILEELKVLYKLDLSESQEKINKAEKMLIDAQNTIKNNDPLQFKHVIDEIHAKIKELKSDFDIIPHLQQQLQESIPDSIDNFLEECEMDGSTEKRIRQELDNLRTRAITDLSKGNMLKSQEHIDKIFAKLNEISNMSEIA